MVVYRAWWGEGWLFTEPGEGEGWLFTVPGGPGGPAYMPVHPSDLASPPPPQRNITETEKYILPLSIRYYSHHLSFLYIFQRGPRNASCR